MEVNMNRIAFLLMLLISAAGVASADGDQSLVAEGSKVTKLAGGMKFTEPGNTQSISP